MDTEALRFLRGTLEKCRVQVLELKPAEAKRSVDLGLRHTLGMEADHERLLHGSADHLEDRTVYRVTDPFRCGYMMLRLPDGLLVLGPWLREAAEPRWIMELAERLEIPAQQLPYLEDYYGTLPGVEDLSLLMACVNTFAERLWGGEEAYRVVDVNRELNRSRAVEVSQSPPGESYDWKIRSVEERYAFENELMQAVSQGLGHKAEQMLAGISAATVERRQADPVRELQNYCIVINTLLRKAAERGGVHPFHLDRASSAYARRIGQLSQMAAGKELVTEMFLEYCRLVSGRALTRYSQVVQRVILQIDADPAGDLSLRALAQRQNNNASYLSDLFRRETGKTLTEYVSQRRVEEALRLLAGTGLQIQTVAQYCGIPDVNYFARVFKRYTGVSPREYRAAAARGGGAK